MNVRDAIWGAVEAYMALVEFDAVVAGVERQLLYGAARAKHREAVSERLAWEIADFLPIACARPQLAAAGMKVCDHYARVDSQGRLRDYRPLNDEPVYREAVAVAGELASSNPAALAALAQQSPEYAMFQSWQGPGRTFEQVDASPPILNGPDELCSPWEQRPTFDEPPWWLDTWKPRKPWWKFW